MQLTLVLRVFNFPLKLLVMCSFTLTKLYAKLKMRALKKKVFDYLKVFNKKNILYELSSLI